MKNPLARWWKSLTFRKYEWQFSRIYWLLLRFRYKAQFLLGKTAFGTRARFRSARESSSVAWSILKATIGSLISAGVIAAILIGLDYLLFTHGARYVEALKARPAVDPATYIGVLTTLAEVAGAFLGLYFTAVSVVASTAYSRAPHDVRALLLREKLGNFYIRIVAHAAALSFIFLTLSAFGLKASIVPFVAISGLGVIAIYSFVVLGLRAFYFFNPGTLSDAIVFDLVRQVRLATPDGFRWQDISFQSHYQQEADRLLRTFQSVVQLTLPKDGATGAPVAELCSTLLSFWTYYSKLKLRIPTESYWFKRIHRHQNWLTSDYNEVNIALATGTYIRPELKPDLLWLESQLKDILCHCVTGVLKQGDVQAALTIVDDLRKTLQAVSANYSIEESRQVIRAIAHVLRKELEKTPAGVPKSQEDMDRLTPTLALLEHHTLGLINIFLGFSERMRSISQTSFDDLFVAAKKRREFLSYVGAMPREVIQQAEYVSLGLEAERAVEGQSVSPVWYQRQMLVLGFLRFLTPTLKKLVDDLESEVAGEADRLISQKRIVYAAEVLQRGMEACHKSAVALEEAQKCLTRLGPCQRVPDVPWPLPDWTALEQKVQKVRERVIAGLAKLSPALSVMPQFDQWPDYFGHAYSVCADECIAFLASRNVSLFKEVFPSFFEAALIAHNRLRSQLAQTEVRARMALSSDPIIDLLDISGYALIYSELDSLSFWDIARQTWDEYLTKLPDPKQTAEFIASLVEYRRTFFAVSPRAVFRTAWQQELEAQLVQRKLIEKRFFGPGEFLEEPATHPSKIIRALTRSGYVFDNAHDVFMVCYLLKRPEASGLQAGKRGEGFAEALDREESDEGERNPEQNP